jgi:DNA polymerase-3 subunit alpha
MDSLSYYYHEHELSHMDRIKYGVSNFFELPEEPIKGKSFMWRGREMYEYETTRIAGTVLDKNKTKNSVTLLTPEGVVTVKLYGGSFSHYDKQISESIGDKKQVLEKSWFARGNKLLLAGFRRGNQFIPKKYKQSIHQHTVARIDDIDDQGNLSLTTERIQV